MKFTAISRMPFSAKAVWPELARVDAQVVRLFFLQVVPLSLLPPAMIYLAGHHYSDTFVQGLESRSWGSIASIFFLGEILSVGLMGWLIHQAARHWHGSISYRNAYLLATIAPIPLWLSSLGLVTESLALNILFSVIALCLSCALVYQGVRALCTIKEDVEAAAITQLVFGAGMLLWGMLLSLVLLPI
ncbi:MAG: DUF1282 family protein [Sterolibacterium sp.]|nr:DUF1282 family protein [Sterolibacterium sp.]